MITTTKPDTWRDLQSDVASILDECGFDVEVEKTIQTARGIVEIDVYAEEVVRGRKYTIACECKHWKQRVPKTVIHSFRTVVSEMGADIGYIVSLNGFQSGSFTAAELTNLELVTWTEFQNAFEESWFETHFTQKIHDDLSTLMTYSEPFLPAWFEHLIDSDKEEYITLKRKYALFGMIMQSFGPYTRRLNNGPIPRLPISDLIDPQNALNTIPEDILNEVGYRELLRRALEHGKVAVEHFQTIRDRHVPPAS